jgi:tRNA threonylcarbamoyladenosine biosynthesis protein TsaB
MTKILIIDTSDNKQITVGLEIDGQISEIKEDSTVLRSEAALPAIEKILSRNNLTINQIDEVKVNRGPGSYTGLRIGISIANALGFLLQIPVNSKKIGELEEPVYNE